MPEALKPRLLGAAVAAACLVASTAAGANPPLRIALELAAGAPSAPESRVPLIATIRLNELDKGEHAIFLVGQDDFLVPRALLVEWLPGLADQPARMVEGEPHVLLRTLAGAQVRFDEQRLVLHIRLPPTSFPRQAVRYLASDRPLPTALENMSAVINYQVGASGPTSGPGSEIVSASLEAAVRRREWLLRTALFQSVAGSEATTGRGLTFLAREDPLKLTRLTFGDFNTGLNEATGGLVLGGISFARALDLDPYTVRQPGAGVQEMIDVPSTISVYIGDNRILRQAVGPGPVDISNITYLAGRRDVRIVVRDAFGRERETSFPFYFADRGLAAGVHDYNYGVGVVRRDLSSARGSYGDLAIAAFHRAGLNNVVTAGAQVQATREVANVGPSLTLRTDRLGVLSLAVLASRDRVRARSGGSGALGYSFLAGAWSAGAFARYASRDFAPITVPVGGEPPPLRDLGASVSWTSQGYGTFTASLGDRRKRDEPPVRSASLGYSYAFSRNWQLQAIWRRSTGPLPLREALLSLQYADREHVARLSYREENDRRAAQLQFGNFQPVGEGFGYNVNGEVVQSPDGSRRILTPELLWNTPYASLQGSVAQTTGTQSGSFGVYQLALSGSIAVVGDRVGFSRLVEDSFAIARVNPPMEGVRVYLNEQLMGRTGRNGELFLPRLVSSIVNSISIDDRDLPIERSLDRRVASTVPWPRSGVLVTFEAPLRRSVAGVMRYRPGAEWKPLEYVLVRVATPKGDVEVPTGRGGEFYVENLPPGDYAATVEADPRRCTFTLRIPASEEPDLKLPDVQTCTPA